MTVRSYIAGVCCGVLAALSQPACDGDDAGMADASAESHAAETDASPDSPERDAAAQDGGERDAATPDATSAANGREAAPSAYPQAWEVAFVDASPLPEDYEFGRQSSTLKKGETFGDQTLALPCDIAWERDIPVTLRDGTVVYVDVLSPPEASDAGTKLPAIMAWSPYGKTLPTASPTTVPPDWFSGIAKFEGPDAAFWVCHGYAIVDVDVRGAYKSEGKVQIFGMVDAADGYDVIEWIARQSWSNGNVGMHGASWLAIAQWNIAATQPPHLKAIAPWNGQSDLFRNSLMQGGIPDTAFSSMVGGILVSEQGVESTVEMLDRYPLWSDYWADKRPKVEDIVAAAYVGADVASALHTAGSFDGFRRLGSKNKWLRANDTNEWHDEYTRDNEDDLLRFFDRYLKELDNDWEQTPRVRISVMDPGDEGESKINTPYEAWPVADTEYRKLYLDGESHALSAKSPKAARQVSYDAEHGQTSFSLEFKEDTQLVGHGLARLYMEADGADDMDIFVLIEKLDRDGTALVPSELAAMYFPKPPPGIPGRLRASMRKLDEAASTDYLPVYAMDTPQKLKAGQVVALDIALMPSAMRWHAGQTLKLTIAGSDIKGSGLPLPTLNKGMHIVHTGADHASYIQVPVVAFTP